MMRYSLCWLVGSCVLLVTSCRNQADIPAVISLKSALPTIPMLGQLQPATPIADISNRPPASDIILIEGTVGQHIPLVNRWLYELQDDSGSIWVLTQESPPTTGDQAKIQAVVHYQSVLVSGQDIGEYYAEEQSRLNSN